MAHRIVTFKLSIATGARDRMVHNLRLIRWYHFNLRLIGYRRLAWKQRVLKT